jgi:hypothetical protein
LLAAGVGVDTELTTHLNLRVEVEYQNWFANGSSGPENINGVPTTGGYLPNGLTPILCQIGFAYHFAGGAAAQ